MLLKRLKIRASSMAPEAALIAGVSAGALPY